MKLRLAFTQVSSSLGLLRAIRWLGSNALAAIKSQKLSAFQIRETELLPSVTSGELHEFSNIFVIGPRTKLMLSKPPDRFTSNRVSGLGPRGRLTSKQVRDLPLELPKRIDRVTTGSFSTVIAPPLNIYHFVVHTLVPFWHLRHKGLVDSQVPLLLLHKPSSYQAELMRIFNIPFRVTGSALQVQQLITFQPDVALLRESLRHFRNSSLRSKLSPPHNGEGHSMIYLARPLGSRSAQPEIARVLADLGYVTIRMDQMHPLSQIATASSAKRVIADHGAAMVNLLFSEVTHVVELASLTPSGHVFGDNCYRDMLDLADMHPVYRQIVGGPTESRSGIFYVPIEPLVSTLSDQAKAE